ncbi:MAG: hypothetical protein WA741_32635 [Candidatus Sulfotelmatobacter sp.]
MSINQCDARGERLTLAAPIADNGGIGPISGEPLTLGSIAAHKMAMVAETSYTQPGNLVPTGNIACSLIGVFFLSVTAKSVLSPGTNLAINPGDAIYADGGTYDSVSGMTYGFTLDANSGGSFFGNCLDAVLAGVTQTARVRLKG